jgi:hypothetical protein
MNLWEGNVTPNIEFDFAHGSASHNTAFRNYATMTCTNPDTGMPMTSALYGVNVAYFNDYETFVGNVLGPYGSTCAAGAYELVAGVPQASTIWKLGYYDDGGTAAPDPSLSDKVVRTILRGGNWDCRSNSVVWSGNVPGGASTAGYLDSRVLPPSLYRTQKPAWFRSSNSSVVWPPIDSSAMTKVQKIPAELCYESGPKAGAPFDPVACYGP